MKKGVKEGAMYMLAGLIIYVIWIVIVSSITGGISASIWSGNYAAAASAASAYSWISSLYWVIWIVVGILEIVGIYKIIKAL